MCAQFHSIESKVEYIFGSGHLVAILLVQWTTDARLALHDH